MKIVFIVDEANFLIPTWLDQVISQLTADQVVAITPLPVPQGANWLNNLLTNLRYLSLAQLVKFTWLVTKIYLNQLCFFLGLSHYPQSITQVAQKYQIKIINTREVNHPQYLRKLTKLKPDIVFSSCSQIFKNKLLTLPKIACINRHTSLLPGYQGVLPIFWGMLNQEKIMGTTIHYMTSKVDQGKIIYQNSFQITDNDTLISVYRKAYSTAVEASVEALNIVRDKKKTVKLKHKMKPSYNSFPQNADWKKFFQQNLKFI